MSEVRMKLARDLAQPINRDASFIRTSDIATRSFILRLIVNTITKAMIKPVVLESLPHYFPRFP